MKYVKAVVVFVRGVYTKEPVRVTALIVAAVAAGAGALHLVINPEDLALIIPLILGGGEVARTQVTPS